MIAIEQGFELLLTFTFANLLGIAFFEVFRGYFKEPLGINRTNFAHILLCCLYKLMVNYPLGTFVEQRRRWMDEDLLVITDRLVAFSWVLAAAVVEETCTDSLAYLGVVLQVQSSARDHGKSESFHDLDQLLTHVLTSFHGASLNEVFVAPLILESVHFPRFVDR